ncbi:MAG: hypothetical protein F6K10_29290 [Moorea sp. SIO2B7]|nr:hypothetical protein [Moorena sp. SIO2B7]
MTQILVPDVPNVSLVAFYGSKDAELKSLILLLQDCIANRLGSKFERYSLGQVHGTIIGCEGLQTEKGILSKWFLELRNESRYIDLAEFITYIRNHDSLPMVVRIGGYDLTIDYQFLSRNQHPYARSFQFQGNIGVLMGWEYKNKQILFNLHRLRFEAQKFNLLHKYYKKADGVDNDFYMRLGILNGKPSDAEITKLEEEIRGLLTEISPLYVLIDVNSLSFIGFQDSLVPVETTRVIPFNQVTIDNLKALYP